MERIKRSRSGRSENERQQKYDAIEARASKSALERFHRPAYQQEYWQKYGGKDPRSADRKSAGRGADREV